MFSDRFIIEPKINIKKGYYRCDSRFHIDDIQKMYVDLMFDTKTFNIIFTDGKTCSWYKTCDIVDAKFIHLYSYKILLQNQFKKGGQSTNRLARNRDIQRDHYLTEIAEKTLELFSCKNNIIICGPAEFKKELSDHKLIRNNYTNIKVLNMNILNEKMILDEVKTQKIDSDILIIKKIEEMILLCDDKLIFGCEIPEYIYLKQIETLFLDCNIDPEIYINDVGYEIKIIRLNNTFLQNYGGVIGVKFH